MKKEHLRIIINMVLGVAIVLFIIFFLMYLFGF